MAKINNSNATNQYQYHNQSISTISVSYRWNEGLRRDHPVVIEPEILMSNYSFLSYNAMSWGYWTPGARTTDLLTPYVSMYKAVTRGRHMTHLTERQVNREIR